MRDCSELGGDVTVGIDLGDRVNVVCVLDGSGEVVLRDRVPSRREAMQEFFGELPRCVVAMETGTHSRWASDLLGGMGFEVLVGNARKIRAIWESDRKSDSHDAEQLARIARYDRKLLHAVKHRRMDAHRDLEVLLAREMLVQSRAKLVNHVRGVVKSFGYRIPKSSTAAFHKRAAANMPEDLMSVISPLLDVLSDLSKRIRGYDGRIRELCERKYPQTGRLMQIRGVGSIVALAYVLTIEDPRRYRNSRTVGAYLGMTPRLDQSGETDKQLRITKAGNQYMRRLLVNSASYIMGPFGEDCDLRRFGRRLQSRGGKSARNRARLAVARKLAVMMHAMWRKGSDYQALGYRAC